MSRVIYLFPCTITENGPTLLAGLVIKKSSAKFWLSQVPSRTNHHHTCGQPLMVAVQLTDKIDVPNYNPRIIGSTTGPRGWGQLTSRGQSLLW